MTGEEKLREALRLVAAGEPRQAPDHVEARLLAEFRKRARWKRSLAWSPVVGAAAAVAAGLLWMMVVRAPSDVAPPPPLRSAVVAPPELPRGNVRRAPARSVRPWHPRPAAQPRPREEVVTAFYPLPDADLSIPLENVIVVRVQLPRSALQIVGLPVNQTRVAERVNAEVLLGQDGLARAVRFVQ